MEKRRTFISFDYDHDSDLKNTKARTRIKGCNVVVVICGKYTNTATGVATELKIAQEEGVPYFLLYGRSTENCVKPIGAKSTDKMYKWTWDNLKALIGGRR